jgi:hypothetical protein
MTSLPPEILTLVSTTVSRDPHKAVEALVSEVVSTLAGTKPDVLVSLVKSAGTFDLVVTAIAEQVEQEQAAHHQSA